MSTSDALRDCLRDLDPDFLRSAAILMAWEYNELFEALESNSAISEEFKIDEFNRGRSACATKALSKAARQHGVPYEFRKLESNGQHKLILKAGRLILIQEPVVSFSDQPKSSDYKEQLASTLGLVRQLELDLGDIPDRITDWEGSALGVILHGPLGSKFNSDAKALGCLMLGIPDAGYTHWVMRLDLQNVAMHGIDWRAGAHDNVSDIAPSTQPDNVRIALKKKRDKEAG